MAYSSNPQGDGQNRKRGRGTGRTGREEGGRAEQEERKGDGQNRKDVN